MAQITREPVDVEDFMWAMALRGLDQQALATIAGCSHSTIDRVLTGERVKATTFSRIIRALASTPMLPSLSDLAVRK